MNADSDELPPTVSPVLPAGSGHLPPMIPTASRCQFFSKQIKTRGLRGKAINGILIMDRKLGQGAYGKVELGKDVASGQLRAMKKMSKRTLLKKKEFKSMPGQLRPKMVTALDKVHKEIDIMKALDHPNIIRLLAVIDDPEEDPLYLVLEHAPGLAIMEWNVSKMEYSSPRLASGAKGSGIKESLAKAAFVDTLKGLKYLHCLGIIHRDIKPDNLLVAKDGSVKICDFGEARLFEAAAADEALCSDTHGTYHFFAPEMCSPGGGAWNGYLVDVWAAGVALYAFLFGKVPFFDEGNNAQKLFEMIADDDVKVPSNVIADKELEAVLLGALRKSPSDRPRIDDILRRLG